MSRHRPRWKHCAVAASLALVWSASAAKAGLVGYCKDLDDLIAQSDAIVVATIRSEDPGLDLWGRYSIDVTDTISGTIAKGPLEVKLRDLSFGEQDLFGGLEPGHRYLLFVEKRHSADGHYSSVNCDGNHIELEPFVPIESAATPRERVLKVLDRNAACLDHLARRAFEESQIYAHSGNWGEAEARAICAARARNGDEDPNPCGVPVRREINVMIRCPPPEPPSPK